MTKRDQSLEPQYLRGTVLVTGGSGFIGSHLVKALLEKGARVVNLDLKPPLLPEHAAYFVQGDLADAAAVKALMAKEKPALVYNLAAQASLDMGPEALSVNQKGLANLMEAVGALPEPPLVVHASTQLVAGPAEDSFDPLALKPYTAYGESKAECERLLRALPTGSRWTIVRPTTIWGPYHPTFGRQIWKYLQKRYYLHPAGKDVVRSWGFVGNVVHQLLRIAEIDATFVEGQTFYVGDAPVMSGQWLDAFSIALSGKPVRRVPLPLLVLAGVAGEISKKFGGPSPINLGRVYRMTTPYPTPMEPTFALLGRGPFSFEQGVALSVDWMKNGYIPPLEGGHAE